MSDESIGNYYLTFNLNNNDPNGIISGAIDVSLGNDREPLVFAGILGLDYGETVTSADVDLNILKIAQFYTPVLSVEILHLKDL